MKAGAGDGCFTARFKSSNVYAISGSSSTNDSGCWMISAYKHMY